MCKKALKTALFILVSFIMLAFGANTGTFAFATNLSKELNINAKSAYLIDYKTGTEIYSKNADTQLPIASMTKLATLSVIFNELDNKTINLTDMVTVSTNAADTEGSSAFLDAGSNYSVADLIKTIVIVSANDSCVAIAEHIAGSEELFVNKMNDLSKKLSLKNTNFKNSTGLPAENHYSCAKDMALIYTTVCDNNLYKQYAKIWMEDFIHPSGRITGLVNTNRLIKTYEGCDSGKTGHTAEAKYCLTASASRAGTRLVSVIIGAENSKSRFDQTKDMFNYGFTNYTSKTVINTTVALAEFDVANSTQKTVLAYAKEEYNTFDKKGDNKTYKTHIIQNDKLSAPIKVGDKLGTVLVLDQNNIVLKEIDLVSTQNIEQITFIQILDNIFNAW